MAVAAQTNLNCLVLFVLYQSQLGIVGCIAHFIYLVFRVSVI